MKVVVAWCNKVNFFYYSVWMEESGMKEFVLILLFFFLVALGWASMHLLRIVKDVLGCVLE